MDPFRGGGLVDPFRGAVDPFRGAVDPRLKNAGIDGSDMFPFLFLLRPLLLLLLLLLLLRPERLRGRF